MLRTLRTKILIGYSITLVLVVIVFVWSFINLRELGQASDDILRENYKSILAAENMIDAIERQDSGTLLFILGYEEEGLTQFNTNESQFLQWLGRARDNITIVGEEKIVEDIDKSYSSYLKKFFELKSVYENNSKRVISFYHEEVLPAFMKVRDGCSHLREVNHETMFTASNRARHIAARALWSMAFIGIAAIIVGLGFSLLLSNLIAKPLKQVMDATQKVATGNYDLEIPTSSSDELGRLASEFNIMIKKLKTFHDLNIKQIIAEKRKSEAIIRSIDDGIVVVDSEFRISDLNPTAVESLHVDYHDVQGKHFLELINNEELYGYIKQSAASGKAPIIENGKNIFTVQNKDTLRHYFYSITPIHTKEGLMLGVVLLLHDVTQLKELDRLKSEFVMTASHELRTPLTSMDMSIELLRETATRKLDEKENQLLTVAHDELQRLKALASDLLDLSKIEAGKMEMDISNLSVPDIFEKTVDLLQAQAKEKSIELSYSIPKRLPEVQGDVNKITWVLTNLIANALRYTDSNGHIKLFAEHVSPFVHISVSDDGKGIPYEYQSKIFEKFVQIKDDKIAGGSGLGLTICKEIIRAHRGTIWVDSTPGKGSTFTFTLPVVE
jgi:NtrC-family two-component system sensor histidine kinase KinB